MMNPTEARDAIAEARTQIDEAVSTIEQVARQFPGASRQAEAYCIAHIRAALGGHGYHSMYSVEDLMNEVGQDAGPCPDCGGTDIDYSEGTGPICNDCYRPSE